MRYWGLSYSFLTCKLLHLQTKPLNIGHLGILSLRKQKLKFPVNNIRNGGLQAPQSSPMGPNFFLAAKWSIYASIWAYEPGRLLLKGQKPENRRRSTGFWYGTSIYCFLGTFWCTSTALKCGGESEIDDDLFYITFTERSYLINSLPWELAKFKPAHNQAACHKFTVSL